MKIHAELSTADAEFLKMLAKEKGTTVDALARELLHGSLNSIGAEQFAGGKTDATPALPPAQKLDPSDPRFIDWYANDTLITLDQADISIGFGQISNYREGFVKPGPRITMSHWTFMQSMGVWAAHWKLLARLYKDRLPNLFACDTEEIKAAFAELERSPTIGAPAFGETATEK